MRHVILSAVFAIVASGGAAQAPAPPPEVAKLGYFEGSWKMEGEDQTGPFGPGGKVSGEEKCEWFEGRFALVCHASMTTPAGKGKSMSTYTWNARRNRYSFDGIDSFGADISANGSTDGKVWRWISIPFRLPDGRYTVRYSVTPVSEKEYRYEWEFAKNKRAYQPGGTGRATRK
jgi:hypothetical protein